MRKKRASLTSFTLSHTHRKQSFWQIFPDRDWSILKHLLTADRAQTFSPSSNTLAAALRGLCARPDSLLPALLVMVVVLWAPAGGGPLGAAVLLGLLQELVQTERILFELDRPFSSLPVVGTWELFVRNKPEGKQEKKGRMIAVDIPSFPDWCEGL